MHNTIFLIVILVYPNALYAMEQETRTVSHFNFSQRGQRSPQVPKILSVSVQPASDIEMPTPSNTPTNSTVFSSYTQTGQVIRMPIESNDNTPEQQVRNECTKFKLVLLASASAIISAGVTAAITYLNASCN